MGDNSENTHIPDEEGSDYSRESESDDTEIEVEPIESKNERSASEATSQETPPEESPDQRRANERLDESHEPSGGTSTVDKEQIVGGVTVFEGEELYHDIQPSWAAYWKDIVIGSCMLMFLIGPYWWMKAYAKRKNSRYVVTSDRVIRKKGSLTGSSTEEVQFVDIDEIRTHQSSVEGLLDKGTVEFSLRERGRQDKTVTLDGISEYESVKTTIRREQYESSSAS